VIRTGERALSQFSVILLVMRSSALVTTGTFCTAKRSCLGMVAPAQSRIKNRSSGGSVMRLSTSAAVSIHIAILPKRIFHGKIFKGFLTTKKIRERQIFEFVVMIDNRCRSRSSSDCERSTIFAKRWRACSRRPVGGAIANTRGALQLTFAMLRRFAERRRHRYSRLA